MSALDFFGMFDYATGDDDTYKYSSNEFSELIEGITGTGVSADALNCFTTTANGLKLTVRSGVAFIKGRYGANHSSKEITLSATTSTALRYDRLVLQLDIERRIMELLVVKGVQASSSPSIPSLTQTNLIYQLPLYLCLVSNGSNVTLTDQRPMTYSVRSIQSELEARSIIGHGHALSDVTGISLNTTATNIKMNGTQSAGTGTAVAKANHVHPVDTSRAAASHSHALSDVTGISLNTTATNIKMNGTQSAGSGTAVAKADHVHPTDTSRAAASHSHSLSDVTGISLNTTASNIKMNGTQSAGSGTAVAKADHVHPTDTSRAAASHTHSLSDVSGISLNTTASNIKMNGTQSAGSGTAVAKANHVHPVDTSRAAASHTHSASDISGLTPSKGSNSSGIYYHKSADGLIVQWGTISSNEDAVVTVNLPLAYTSTSSYTVMITAKTLAGHESTAYPSTTSRISVGLSANSGNVSWLAIGY